VQKGKGQPSAAAEDADRPVDLDRRMVEVAYPEMVPGPPQGQQRLPHLRARRQSAHLIAQFGLGPIEADPRRLVLSAFEVPTDRR